MLKRVAAASAVAVSLGLVVVGCSGRVDPTPTATVSRTAAPAASFVGETLQYALAHSPGSIVSEDASKELGLRPASADLEASETVVIAACYYRDSQLNVLVIPSTSLTQAMNDDAQKGKYDSLLTDCRK